uniref:Uncharacterized protein n=1 Tax=Rhizophora mucronata TaxID=61149 RepID=A0A2P2KU59_RHIMU
MLQERGRLIYTGASMYTFMYIFIFDNHVALFSTQ